MKDLLQQLQQLAPMAAAVTPGDWKQSHRKVGGESYFTQVYDAAGETIATLSWHAKPMDETGGIGTYREANAAFIAAARNLLTPENLTLIIGLLSNMDSVMDTNRVLAKRQFEIQGLLETDLDDDTKLYLVSETINPSK